MVPKKGVEKRPFFENLFFSFCFRGSHFWGYFWCPKLGFRNWYIFWPVLCGNGIMVLVCVSLTKPLLMVNVDETAICSCQGYVYGNIVEHRKSGQEPIQPYNRARCVCAWLTAGLFATIVVFRNGFLKYYWWTRGFAVAWSIDQFWQALASPGQPGAWNQ